MITIDPRKRKLEDMKGQMSLDVFMRDVLKIKRVKQSANNYLGLCPFHQDSHRSFGVSIHYPHEWGCMTASCKHGKSIESLVMQMQDISVDKAQALIEEYMGYIKRISEKTLDLTYYEEEDEFSLSNDLLIDYSCGYSTHKYFFSRGLNKEMMYKFKVGYDRFRKRVVFPIFQDGRLINFVGRTIEKDVEPKYLIYEEVDRDTFMFGEHVLPKRIPYLITYEGVLETVYSHQHNVQNCVSLLGAFVTKKHVERMLRYSDTIVDFLDNDDAGRAAGEKLKFYVNRLGGQYRKVRHLSEDKKVFKDLLDYRSPKIFKMMIKIAANTLVS